MKIGIFDSGLGGLSVLHEACHQLPDEEYIFYADRAHAPYGVKPTEEIFGYVDSIVTFLLEQGCDAIVIACNTATSVAVRKLRERYYNMPGNTLKIVGMEPAVKPAVADNSESSRSRVLVMATPVTIREAKLKNLIDRVDENHIVDLLAMPGLVTLAESETFSGEAVTDYLDKQFSQIDPKLYSSLVLGCTHFNYFKDSYRKYFDDDTRFIDGNFGTIRYLANLLELPMQNLPSGSVHFDSIEDMTRNTRYFISGREVENSDELGMFTRLHNRLEELRDIR